MTRDNPYKIGDPVVDLAQGRPMIVLEAPDTTVAEWSDANGYELTDNYANAKLGADPEYYVVECAYVSNIRSEPSKTYTCPVSRVALIDAHHADDGRRIYDRVAVDLLKRLFSQAMFYEDATDCQSIVKLAHYANVDIETVNVALELADVERTIGGED